VGDAVLLRGSVSTDTSVAQCGLGTLSVSNSVVAGEVDVLLRPEQLVVAHSDEDADGAGIVSFSRFFGHDGIVVVSLPTGESVEMRLHAMSLPSPGDSVAIKVNGTVLAYNRH
jgi:iron(III) transport system ATP-binding protein